MRKTVFCFVVVFNLIGNVSFAQEDEFDPYLARALQSALDQSIEASGLTGASVAVVESDQSSWTGASGFSNPATGQAISADMLFGFGSITKSFTSALILQLVEENLISLDDSISTWLPQKYYSLSSETFRFFSSTTIRQLLNHTSGISDYDQVSLASAIFMDFERILQPEELIDDIVGAPISPGDEHDYSNVNYHFLGMIIEAVTGQDYSDVLDNRLLEPLNLAQTFLEDGQSNPDDWATDWFLDENGL